MAKLMKIAPWVLRDRGMKRDSRLSCRPFRGDRASRESNESHIQNKSIAQCTISGADTEFSGRAFAQATVFKGKSFRCSGVLEYWTRQSRRIVAKVLLFDMLSDKIKRFRTCVPESEVISGWGRGRAA
ncbi:hypothetical protein [Rhizobium gallicum]|uniref:hypothetical protein n=1 Tax=Rhizobium gallicum TaxID=56730 RepID=UPI001EF84ABA|nr:hypothetical protein [Rhizobium gallicum]ULJ74178.1 hypothetical protein L2W42_05800 [Rhizobium gallicum]